MSLETATRQPTTTAFADTDGQILLTTCKPQIHATAACQFHQCRCRRLLHHHCHRFRCHCKHGRTFLLPQTCLQQSKRNCKCCCPQATDGYLRRCHAADSFHRRAPYRNPMTPQALPSLRNSGSAVFASAKHDLTTNIDTTAIDTVLPLKPPAWTPPIPPTSNSVLQLHHRHHFHHICCCCFHRILCHCIQHLRFRGIR